MTAYDNWLEKPYQYKYEEEDTLDDLEYEILQSLNVDSFDRFTEAFCEGAFDAEKEYISEWLKNREFEKLGRLFWLSNQNYWEKVASKQAFNQLKGK